MPNFASFFSGIGGIDLGFERAGFDVKFQCEIEPFCTSILQQHWPANVARFSDIRDVELADVPVSDVWAGGFPCQDVSLARMGPRAGLKGKNRDSFLSLLDYLSKVAPEFSSSRTFQVSSLATTEGTSDSFFKRWPASGIVSDGVCLTAGSLESPNLVKESTLSGVIETGSVQPRYFLSPNAARGILRRAERMGRTLFPPLRQALEILSKGQ